MNLKDAGIYDLVNIFKGEATKAHGSSQGGIINGIDRLINIPAYQRPYRWKSDNIIRLFEDYDENNSEYFLGSAVAVEKQKDDGTVEFDVVDGQQRLLQLKYCSLVCY